MDEDYKKMPYRYTEQNSVGRTGAISRSSPCRPETLEVPKRLIHNVLEPAVTFSRFYLSCPEPLVEQRALDVIILYMMY